MSPGSNLDIGSVHRWGMAWLRLSGSSRGRIQQVPEGEEGTRHTRGSWGGVTVAVGSRKGF